VRTDRGGIDIIQCGIKLAVRGWGKAAEDQFGKAGEVSAWVEEERDQQDNRSDMPC